jgi:hypothetical protein
MGVMGTMRVLTLIKAKKKCYMNNQCEVDNSQDLGADERLEIQLILYKYGVRILSGFNWL